MCQNKICLNTNVKSLVVDRYSNIIPTYSRTKKPKRLMIHSLNASETDSNILMGHFRKYSPLNAQANCDYLNCHVTERNGPCSHRMSLNMNRSSCIMTKSLNRSHRNDEETSEITRTFDNFQQNAHRHITKQHQMTKKQHLCAFNKYKVSHVSQKLKRFRSSSKL